MIKVQFTGSPPNMYQIDRSYNLPGITGAVQWNGSSKCFEVSDGDRWIRIDNTVEFTTNSPDVWAMYAWIEEQKAEKVKEQELRSKYPTLDEAYKHYQFIKELVKAGPVTSDDEVGVQASTSP